MTEGAGEATRHLPVFHCPYCGDEELTPYEAPPGSPPSAGWQCAACLRAFTVRLIATGVQQG